MLSCHIDPFSAFVCDLQIEGCEVHLYRGANTFGCILEPPPTSNMGIITYEYSWKKQWWNEENVYFLAGVRPGLRKRAADSDVLKRGMFTIDFDIRKEMEKRSGGPGIFEGIFDGFVESILLSLEKHPLFSQYRYAVLSGNGLHLHYFGSPCDVSKEEWKEGMRTLFDEIDTIVSIPCDHGCGNAGRIMRMPGSWNVKDPTRKLPVEVIVWMPGVSVPPMEFVQERGRRALTQHRESKAAERAAFEAVHDPQEGDDVIALINRIPIEQVVLQLLGCKVGQIKKDGGMRFVDDKGVERGFFKHKDYNIVVHEGTSLFAAPKGVGYNCLGLWKEVMGLSTPAAVEWFALRSQTIMEARRAEKQAWATENASHELDFFESLLTK